MAIQPIKYRAPKTKKTIEEELTRKEVECPVDNALRRNARGGMWFVRCEFREGMAILYGKVASYYLKQIAQETARSVEGVELVINRVNVSV